MKNKLWVFGCSFSRDNHEPRIGKGWFDYIAEEFDLDYWSMTLPGYGWSKHKELLYQHLPLIEDDDLVIVQNSHLIRMYSEFFKRKFASFKYLPISDDPIEPNDDEIIQNILLGTKNLDEIEKQNWSEFLTSLRILNKFVKRWYWWTFEFHPNSEVPSEFVNSQFGNKLLKFENNIMSYNEWMRRTPSYCINPPNDLHQTYHCHKIQGELFIKQIKDYEKR